MAGARNALSATSAPSAMPTIAIPTPATIMVRRDGPLMGNAMLALPPPIVGNRVCTVAPLSTGAPLDVGVDVTSDDEGAGGAFATGVPAMGDIVAIRTPH
jgi:hypothetical protein